MSGASPARGSWLAAFVAETTDIQAVIWQSDLRGFTPMADRLPSADLIALLNSFFDCQVPAIAEHGGEMLKFLGDGLLAIFPVADAQSVVKTCNAALAAARAMDTAIAAAPEEMHYGLALHIGQVSYGNIGGGDRLDFTCIGPAVNPSMACDPQTSMRQVRSSRRRGRGVGYVPRARSHV